MNRSADRKLHRSLSLRAGAALLFACTLGAPARADSLLGDDFESGAFGGPLVQFTSLADDFALLMGGYGAWVLNGTFAIGGAGLGLVNDVVVEDAIRDGILTYDGSLQFGYGGLFLQYIASPTRVSHVTGQLVIGGGGASYDSNLIFEDLEDSGDAFLVLEPSAAWELNITEKIRLSLGGGYRMVSGVDLSGLEDADLSGAVGTLGVKIGDF